VASPSKLNPFFSSHDLLVVTETKCSRSNIPQPPLSFELLDRPCSSRGQGRSGGLAVYLRRAAGRSMSVWRVRPNCLWVRVDGLLPGGPTFIGAVYLPPGKNNQYLDPSALDTLERDVHDASALGSVLLAGDFNARTRTDPDLAVAVLDDGCLSDRSGDPRSVALPPRRSPDTAPPDARGRALLSFCRASSLTIANGRLPGNSGLVPTSRGVSEASCAVVDYFLVSPRLLSSLSALEVTVVDPHVSDHNLLTLSWPLAPVPDPAPDLPALHRPQYRLPRTEAAASRVSLALSLCLDPRHPLPSSLSVDDACSRLQDSVISVLDTLRLRRCAPRPSARRGHPWFTPAIARLTAATRRCADRLRALPASHPGRAAARQALQGARAAYRVARRKAESRWRDTTAASYVGLASANPRRFWASVFDSSPVVPQATSAAMSAYFEALLNPAVPPVDIDTVAPLGSGPPPDPAALETLARLVDPFTDEEVHTAIKELKAGRAADIFGLKAEALKLLSPYVPSHLTPLLNRFLLEGFPRCLSTSVLVPIFKGKGDAADPSNFRGISITPIFSKLYACLLERRLSGALDAARLRADSQFGFRRRRGTREAAFVLRAVVEAQRGPVFCAFVDFMKAFDSVQRPLLWRLLRNLSVPEAFVQAVESYYAHVAFQVELPSGLGSPRVARVGVRQGCPLSPVLFGVFVEALLRRFLEASDSSEEGLHLPTLGRVVPGSPQPATPLPPVPPILYADDLVLLALSAAGLQRQLDRLQRVASEFGLVINISKTKLMALGPRSPAPPTLPPLSLGAEPLEWVEEFRYLGLLLHHRKGFAHAAPGLHASALSKYHAMVRQCKARGIQDATSLSLLFDSLVTSVLGYGAPIWGPDVFAPGFDDSGALLPLADPRGETALAYERLQRRFMRYVLGLPQDTTHLALHVETRRPPLALQFFKHTARFLDHLRDESVFPADSLVRQALAASADYSSSQESWLRRLQGWSAALGSPFDLASCIPPLLQTHFAATPTTGGRTRAAVAQRHPRPPMPAKSAVPTAFEYWVTHSLVSSTTSYPNPPMPAVSFWTRRLPSPYLRCARLSDRALLSASRLRLRVGGACLFSPLASDLRELDPDPDPSSPTAADIRHLALSFHIDPSIPLHSLLADPPPSWIPFIRSLLRYMRMRNSHAPRSDLLQVFPVLSQSRGSNPA
jgi:hypothetical protein